MTIIFLNSNVYSPWTYQLVEYGEVVGIGQESAVSLRVGERSSVHAGEDAGERARRAEFRADARTDRRVPLRGVQRSDVLIAELRDRHACCQRSERWKRITDLAFDTEDWVETHGESRWELKPLSGLRWTEVTFRLSEIVHNTRVIDISSVSQAPPISENSLACSLALSLFHTHNVSSRPIIFGLYFPLSFNHRTLFSQLNIITMFQNRNKTRNKLCVTWQEWPNL